MNQLTIEQIKQLKACDWLFIKNFATNSKAYWYTIHVCTEKLTARTLFDEHDFLLKDYGKTWVAYRSKQEYECKGKIIELPLPVGTKVYIVPCYLRNTEITAYEILSYSYDGKNLLMFLSICKKQKDLKSIVNMNVENFGTLIFETLEQAEKHGGA